MLVHLRSLAVRLGRNDDSNSYSIPSSIANLWGLETFIVRGFVQKLIVPDSIWDLTRLRHLHICRRAYFSLCNHRFENSSLLENLQTLSEVPLNSGNGLEEILRRLASLRKLRCIIWDQWDYAGRIAKLDFPTEIESLNVRYTCRLPYRSQLHFPSNLRKLTLSCSAMPWFNLPELARQLPNLEVLKLRYRAFEGRSWEVVDGCFQHLRMLKLEAMDFEDWSANADSFPCLERLVVHDCEQLKEIPLSVGDIPTLKMIEVKWCSRSVVDSAPAIHQKQLQLGNEDFKVEIQDTRFFRNLIKRRR